MSALGIRFAPLNVPMQRRLQTVAAGTWFLTFAFGGIFSLFLTIYLTLFTRLWWLMGLYVAWIWSYDQNTPAENSRRIEWVRSWTWWKYVRDYFPLRLIRCSEGDDLDPKRNYLFCCFPHGMLSTGVFNLLFSNAGEACDLFPHHKTHLVTLSQHFAIPFFRELAMAMGARPASATAINHVLSAPGGGHIIGLLPGGAAEAFYCRPGNYRIVLKKRKGFIKLALKNGSPLVPVLSFGETDLFTQLDNPEGSMLRRVQEYLRKFIGFAPIMPLGRGFFQYSFGIIPQRKAVTTVVGRPIEVDKVENPTSEQIETLHQKFTDELVQLFEKYKFSYLENPEEKHLDIE